MFVGHYAVALAAKKPAPEISLGTLFIASQFLDLIWPIFLFLGIESVGIVQAETPFLRLDLHDYPISHSLLTVVGWSVAFAGVHYALKRNTRGALIVGLVVFSHWVLDLITHRPDIPLFPGSTSYIGLGLWNSFIGTMLVEGLMFAGAVLLYARTTIATDKAGSYGFWTMIGFLTLLYFGNAFGPPPPDAQSIAWSAVGLWLFIPWMYWVDKHRRPRTA